MIVARLVLIASTGALFGACGTGELEPAQPVRGVVLIVIDTLRADHVGASGSTLELALRVDALAQESIVCRNAIAASS